MKIFTNKKQYIALDKWSHKSLETQHIWDRIGGGGDVL